MVIGPPAGHGDDQTVPSESFPKSARILVRRDFLRIQNQGLRIHSKHLVFQFLAGGTGESRLGITVSRKVGNAVLRTQLKRWIREAFRTQPALRPGRGDGQPSYDLVITAKRGVEDFSYAALQAELTQVITRHLRERKQPSKRGGASHGAQAGTGAGQHGKRTSSQPPKPVAGGGDATTPRDPPAAPRVPQPGKARE